MIEAIQFMVLVWGAYRRASTAHKPQYVAVLKHGVPMAACFIATDRQAWEIARIAIENRTWEPTE